jgi:hypothetical protein
MGGLENLHLLPPLGGRSGWGQPENILKIKMKCNCMIEPFFMYIIKALESQEQFQVIFRK